MDYDFDALADKADRYADAMADAGEPDPALLRVGLESDYDVINAEALDYILRLRLVDDFQSELVNLHNRSESYLVVGRLRICAALSSKESIVGSIKFIDCDHGDEYCMAWERAAHYLRNRDAYSMNTLLELSKRSDLTVASLAQKLVNFVS